MDVSNAGPWATDASLNDTLPKSVRLRSARPSQGRCALRGKRTVDCALGRIDNGGTATVTVVVRPTRKGTITSTARVRSSQTDTNSQNDRATAQTTVN
jgi:uncharacterized protein DUF11